MPVAWLRSPPSELTETTTQAFMGMSLTCARCHNHPMEKWTNDQYYGMANLFARVRTKTVSGTTGMVVFAASIDDGNCWAEAKRAATSAAATPPLARMRQQHDLPAAGCRPDIEHDEEFSSYFWGAIAGGTIGS